jgi:hypothetical protein
MLKYENLTLKIYYTTKKSLGGRNKTMSLGGHLEEYQLEKQPAEQRQEIGSPDFFVV